MILATTVFFGIHGESVSNLYRARLRDLDFMVMWMIWAVAGGTVLVVLPGSKAVMLTCLVLPTLIGCCRCRWFLVS